MVIWSFALGEYKQRHEFRSESSSHTVYERKNIPVDFMNSNYTVLQNFISKLEMEESNQRDLNDVYDQFCDCVKTEMKSKLAHKTVNVSVSGNNKKRKIKKPWWNDELTELWNNSCRAEKRMLNSDGSTRQKLRIEFKAQRKAFDKCVQKSKRRYWFDMQKEIENLAGSNQSEFWRKIGKIRVGQERGKNIPFEVKNEDGSFSSQKSDVLGKWKSSFEGLLNSCFMLGLIPESWSHGIINPIPKSSTADRRDPLSYRGITLTSVVYKIYCNILNRRLSAWEDENNILHDEQNGFRAGRSTVDHLSSFSLILESRKLKRQSTFTAFIDFKKAYDTINRNKLFTKIKDMGVNGNMFKALLAIYQNVKCCVRLNGLKTDWFSVKCGLKQGCSLSPMLFNLYINDLISAVKNLDLGINIDGQNVSILLYADDIVLVSDCEDKLQLMLDVLQKWCDENSMKVNSDKSKIVHFRPPSIPCTMRNFKCGDEVLEVENHYVYLGLYLSEHCDFNVMAKHVAKSANRALGLLISKYKLFGGLPFSTYSKLYEATVWSTISYGAAIWGDRQFSCISAIQNRAARFFMGVGKYTPNVAVNGDIGWVDVYIKQLSSVLSQWYRIRSMSSSRLNYKIYQWSVSQINTSCKNWSFRLRKLFIEAGVGNIFDAIDISNIDKVGIKDKVLEKQNEKLIDNWKCNLNAENACIYGSKLDAKGYIYLPFEQKAEAIRMIHHYYTNAS
ncbi:uncharacterized protein LOC128554398 [Mercenaria mercenaria]|uniref:uncharacterized protein LOC128554398 n=1 Tax=Mercenaria mercenaria TaxID=6596 RepID=UPI00234E8DCE|nr:uncharacterized protein LOC128554398 [Mercenaria mercenaria]